MKKVSAFSVFNGKKKGKEDTVMKRPPLGQAGKEFVTMRRAHSSLSMDRSGKKEPGSGSKTKRFLNALKSGNIRESIRLSGKKSRPSSLQIIDTETTESPFSAFDQLSVGSSSGKGYKQKGKLETTPVTRKVSTCLLKRNPAQHGRKSAQTSTTSLRQKINSPRVPHLDFDHVSPSDAEQFSEDRKKINKRKRAELSGSSGKKRRKLENDVIKVDKRWRLEKLEFPYMYDSTQEARQMFECIIHPVKTERFFAELWEKKPLLVKRHSPAYNKGWFSTSEFDRILRQENIHWGVNLDATSFVNDKRETHNQFGRAHAPVVWDMYQAGCSMRLLNPQTYSRSVWKVLSVLQEYFSCCMGANIYLTPPGTQGFAPHYDDIEAFIIQLEGKKHWRLYSPRNDDEVLPQLSSDNLSQSEVGEPVLDVVLEAGDLLYFPRGTIHQGDATDEHSLHITVSCYQMNAWGDLLKKLLPAAIDIAVEKNSEFRKGLPQDYLNYMGIVHSEKDLPTRKVFVEKIQSLMSTIIDCFPIDSACDQMGKQVIIDSMPPVLSEGEKSCSVHGAGERWEPSLNSVLGVSEMSPTTEVKLIRRGALRLLTEEDEVRIYYNVENARVYRKAGTNYMDISADMAPAVEFLINAYPKYTTVECLPLENVADQLNIVSMLYEKGLLITSEPLEPTYDEPEDETDE